MSRRRNDAGFTLIDLYVVVVLVGTFTLVGIALNRAFVASPEASVSYERDCKQVCSIAPASPTPAAHPATSRKPVPGVTAAPIPSSPPASFLPPELLAAFEAYGGDTSFRLDTAR